MNGRRYLLDTNIVSNLIRQPVGPVYTHIASVGRAKVCTSIIVACELRYGAAKSASTRLRNAIEGVLLRLPVEPFNKGADDSYAHIRAALESQGTPIGPNDLLIAAHALSLGLTLVTNNMREFGRVSGLTIEDWLG